MAADVFRVIQVARDRGRMSNSDSPLWFVRAGRNGVYAEHFLKEGVVTIGWGEVGEISPTLSDSEIGRRFDTIWPDEKPRTRKTWSDQVKRFHREFQEGNGVATYDPASRLYHIGTILSPAEVQRRNDDGQERAEFVRRVEWESEHLRDSLSIGTRHTLGSSLTLFLVSGAASTELLETTAEGSASGSAVNEGSDVADTVDSEDVLQDYISQSEQLIEDQIASLDWQELQELVAGILRSMGYRTRVSGPGSDRGVDIFASPDGLGLIEPRIFVEVKHRGGRVGAPEIRSFMGGRQPGDRCLYVSTGGFTMDARYEADRSSIPLTLISMPGLRELLVDYYEALDTLTRSLVPLRKIFLPATE